MKRKYRIRMDTINEGRMNAFQKKRADEGRSAFKRAVAINESNEVTVPRKLLRGPVGGPWWLFRPLKGAEA